MLLSDGDHESVDALHTEVATTRPICQQNIPFYLVTRHFSLGLHVVLVFKHTDTNTHPKHSYKCSVFLYKSGAEIRCLWLEITSVLVRGSSAFRFRSQSVS